MTNNEPFRAAKVGDLAKPITPEMVAKATGYALQGESIDFYVRMADRLNEMMGGKNA